MEAFVGVIILVLGGKIYGVDSDVYPSEKNCNMAITLGIAKGEESGLIKPGSDITTSCTKITVKGAAAEAHGPSTEL